MRPASCDWQRCLGCEILMQVVPSKGGLSKRLFHDDACRKAFYREKKPKSRKGFPRFDLTNKILGGILCTDYVTRSETCWVTLWQGVCIHCGHKGLYRSTNLRFNPPNGCGDCRKKAR